MKSDNKTKNELIEELESVRRKVKKLETLLEERKSTEQSITEHKRESEEASRMVTVVRDSNDAITIQDFDGKITAWNHGAELMFGYREQEALQMKIWQLVPTDKMAEQKDFNQRLFAGEKISSFETQRLTKDGRLLDVWLTATKLVDDAGKVIGIAATERDITERKRAEEKLLESERLLQKSQSIANLGSFVFDISKGFWSSSKILDDIFGIDENYIRSLEGWAALPHPDWSAIMTKYIVEEVIGKRQKFNKEYKITRKADGKERWVHGLGVLEFDKNNQPIKLIGTISDITERKLAEEALRKSEEKYRSIFENVQDVYYETLFDGTILEISPSVEVISKGQYHRADLIGKSIFEFYNDPKDRDAIIEAMQKTGSVTGFEVRLKNRDGSFISCSISAKMVFNAEGRPEKIIGSMHDISAGKLAEQELMESKALIDAVVENVPLMIFLKEAIDLRFVVFNRAGEELLGYDRKALLGKNNLDLFPPEQAAHFMAKDREVLDGESGMLDIPEEPIMTAKKGQRLLHTRKVCIRGSDGTTKYLLGISEDITERKQAEEEIEILARFPFENPNPVLRIERDGKINYANPASESLLRFWNCTVGEYLPLDWRERVVNAVRYNTSTIVEVECEERFYSIMVVPILEAGYVNFYGRNITKRKQTEEALQESETRYRSVLQSATDAIVTVDSGGMVVGWNSAAERIFGYSYTEAVGQSLTSIMSFYPFDKHTNGMKGLQSEGGQNIIGKTVEFKGFRKDKSVFPIELSLSSWETKSEQFFTGIIRDITERKRAEAARQESELRFRSLYENTTVGLYRTTPDGNILLANPALVKMLGYTSFEKLAERNLEKDGFESSSQRKEFIEKIERDGEVIGHDSKWVRQDGAAIFVVESARAIRDSQGKTMYYDGTVEDITEHKRAEDTVRESEEKFRIMFENVFDGISIYSEDPDPNKRILVECNEQYAAMSGRSCKELLQLGNTQGLQRTLEDTANNNRVESLEKRTAFHGSFSWIRPDGKDNIIEYVGVPITWRGKPYSIGIDRDITERKLIEEQLRQMQKLEGLGTLAGGIAHDFNNILGIILAYITSIKRFKGDTKKLDLAVDNIMKAVNRGKTLVQQILTFARKSDTAFGAVNVNDVVMEIMTMILETFPKLLTYAQNFDKGVSYINADRSQLHQALLNLCVNARDAMPKGGVLTINTRMVSSISLSNQHPDAAASGYVCIEVSDTGEGMTPETQKRIFEPFFTTKEIGKGTGLGLSVVFGIVQTHKGFIDVESEPGKGTTFRLYLPASHAAEPISANEKEETLEEISGGTETLLVVEDEEMLMMSLRMVLVEKGYKVLSVGDGLAAVNIYKERKKEIALVLTDLGLPKMNGMEECVQIKKINPNARMILATGFLDPEMKSEFLKAGIQNFLFKPYDLTKVLKVIREVLDEK